MSVNELPSPPTDAISSVRFSPDGGALLVGAWDSGVHIYTRTQDGLQFTSKVDCDAPILDVAWHGDGATFFTVGLDHEVAKYELTNPSESRSVLSSHSEAANKVEYSNEHGILVSTSWAGTMHVHDLASGRYVPVKLASKPFALSLTATHAVVAMAERKVHVFDLSALKGLIAQAGVTASEEPAIEVGPWQQRESALKFMTRDLTCMPDGNGFASSSIEGRVGVEWFDEELNKNTYAFKCHRDKINGTVVNAETGEEEVTPVDVIYPVNAIAFHPVYETTFATGGGDGVVVLWDAKTRRRVKQYPKLPASVAALHFSPDGKMLAIGVSPGFEDGNEQEEPDPSQIKVFIRELGDTEAKGKASKDKVSKEDQ